MWRSILGKGAGIYDINSTDKSRALLAKVIAKLHFGIGNDYYKVVEFSGHPMFQLADENEWWKLNPKMTYPRWKRILKQQSIGSGGHITIMDSLASTELKDNFNVEIREEDIDGKRYKGDAFQLFNRLTDQFPERLQYMEAVVIMCTPGIFNRLKEQKSLRHRGIEQSYLIDTLGHDGSSNPIKLSAKNVLQIDGYYVVNKPEWLWMDSVCGTITHRIAAVAQGVLAIGYDVAPQEQDNGMGLDVEHVTRGRYKGKSYFSADFELGTTILGADDYVAHGSLILTPDV